VKTKRGQVPFYAKVTEGIVRGVIEANMVEEAPFNRRLGKRPMSTNDRSRKPRSHLRIPCL